MKIDDEVRHLQKSIDEIVPVSKKMFGKLCKEYCFLYRNVYNVNFNPSMKLMSHYGTTNVYLDKAEYIDMLKDLALLRYKFSRKKFKGYGNVRRA